MSWFNRYAFTEICQGEDLEALASAYARAKAYADLAGYKEVRNLVMSDGTTLLMHCHKAPARMLQGLMDLGEDATPVDNNGFNVLHLVARSGCAQAVECLVKAGARLEEVSNSGKTPLQMACTAPGSTLETIGELLRMGANPNALEPGGMTALHWLGDEPSWGERAWEAQAVDLLVGHGASVNQRTLGGSTPLSHLLAKTMEKGALEKLGSGIISALLDHGAVVDPLSGQFEIMALLAVRKDDADLLWRLQGTHGDVTKVFHGVDRRPLLHEAFDCDAPRACVALLEMGADAASCDGRGRSVASLSSRSPGCAQILASFNARRFSLEALMQAASGHTMPAGRLLP